MKVKTLSLINYRNYEDLKIDFINNINTHKLQIKNEVLNKVSDRIGLETELRVLAKHVDFTADTVDVDSESMIEALNSYYHMHPVLTEYFDSDKLITFK